MLRISCLLILLALNSQLNAEVITDGTLGAQLDLPGPDFKIEANLGQQVGGNLFHSFQDFNLQSHESATFSGPDSINMIFSRVTGGNPSQINGTIRSTIPNAELFFLNPAGIVFGEQARLEVQGSQLAVAPQADFSLIGGDLTLNHAQLNVDSGRFNLVSVASKGEVIPKEGRLDVRIPETSSFTKLGHIKMSDSHIETSGSSAGGISIRGSQVWIRDSLIHAHTLGD